MSFLERLIGWTRRLHEEGRELILCGDMNIARSEIDVHPRERKPQAIGQRPDERALFEELLGDQLVDVGRARPRQPEPVHLVGALAQLARAQHRLAAGLRAGVQGHRRAGDSCVVLKDVGTSDHAPVVMTTN